MINRKELTRKKEADEKKEAEREKLTAIRQVFQALEVHKKSLTHNQMKNVHLSDGQLPS